AYDVARHTADDKEEQIRGAEEMAERTKQAYVELKSIVEPGTELQKSIERSEAASVEVQRLFKQIVMTPQGSAQKP
ncbi:hypothetical protein, partial [Klebsiella pneumoniae]|uniref:hypothetical protein n=1 Tax=Klebsiella pneumoniae TaxID=573 RepID=UPI0030083C94